MTHAAHLIALANRCPNPALERRYRDLATMLAQREPPTKSIAKKIAEIQQIKRDGSYANPLAHLRNKAQA